MTLAYININFSIIMVIFYRLPSKLWILQLRAIKDLLGHDALHTPTTKLIYIILWIAKHIFMSFTVSEFFDLIFVLVNVLLDLMNENLFNNYKSASSMREASIIKLLSRLFGEYHE